MIHLADAEKISFISKRGTYCYKRLPFGLKNIGAIVQHLTNKMSFENFGKTMEVYIDDMLVKSMDLKDRVRHLE